MNVKNDKVLVVGGGKTGVSLIEFLHQKGARVIFNDRKPVEEVQRDLGPVAHIPYQTICGNHPEDLTVYDNPDWIILSPGVPADLPFLRAFAARGKPVMGEIEWAFRFMKAPVIAITGTNGKTTTTALTGEMFRQDGKAVEVVGNIGVPAISKAETLGTDGFYIMEVSSFQLETIQTFRPKAAALLNITPDHINRHGTLEAYAAQKYRIFQNQQPQDLALVNADSPPCMAWLNQIPSAVWLFSRNSIPKEGLFLRDDQIWFRRNGQDQWLLAARDVRIPGRHNLENAMAAAGLALRNEVSVSSVRHALRTFQGVEHRLEFVDEINGVVFINDSKATNPEATMKAVEAIARPIILLAGGMDKKSDFSELIQIFPGSVRYLVVYGETGPQLHQTALENGFHHVRQVGDLEEAFEAAVEAAVPGQAIMLSPACASWDMYRHFEERGLHFKSLVSQLSTAQFPG